MARRAEILAKMARESCRDRQGMGGIVAGETGSARGYRGISGYTWIMANMGEAFGFAAAQSGKVAAHAKGNWRKIIAFGAASAIVFVAAAAGYAAFKRDKDKDEDNGEGNNKGDADKGADDSN